MSRCQGVKVLRCQGVEVLRCRGVEVLRCQGVEGRRMVEVKEPLAVIVSIWSPGATIVVSVTALPPIFVIV